MTSETTLILAWLVLAHLVADFLLTRKPHEVSTKEAAWWSAFLLAIAELWQRRRHRREQPSPTPEPQHHLGLA